jgi:hypothetical protein
VSFLTGGWRLNWTGIDTDQAEPTYYFAGCGLSAHAESRNQPTSTGTTALTGFGFQPSGVLAASWNLVANAGLRTTTDHVDAGSLSLGFAEGSEQVGVWSSSKFAVPTQTARAEWLNDTIRLYSAAATGSSSTLNAAADLQTFDSDGLTWNWTAADATARQYLLLAVGEEVVTPQAGGIKWFQNPLLFCCQAFWPASPAARREGIQMR